jgi:hypothetical protein
MKQVLLKKWNQITLIFSRTSYFPICIYTNVHVHALVPRAYVYTHIHLLTT